MKRILFIKLASIGDILLSTPALEALRDWYPNKEIGFLVSKSCQGLVRDNIAETARVIVIPDIDRKQRFSLRLMVDYTRLLFVILRLRLMRFDIAIILHRSYLLGLICRLAGIPERIGFTPEGRNFLTKGVPFDLNKHRIERNMDVIKILVEKDYNPELKISIRREDIEWVEQNLLLKEQKDPLIAICPGGGKNVWSEMPSRLWPESMFAQLSDRLIEEYNAKIFLVGASSDKKISDKVMSMMKNKPINLTGQTSIGQASAIFKRCDLYIGNDSALLFLAAATGIPTIGIFGPTNGSLINPIGNKHLFIQSTSHCSPCYNPIEGINNKSYICQSKECMKNIKVQDVLSNVSDIFRLNY